MLHKGSAPSLASPADWKALYRAIQRSFQQQLFLSSIRIETIADRHNLRALWAGVPGVLTTVQLENLMRSSGGTCFWCHGPLPIRKGQFDHIVPLSRGGPNTIENIRFVCQQCNRHKGVQDPVAFARRIGGDVSAMLGIREKILYNEGLSLDEYQASTLAQRLLSDAPVYTRVIATPDGGTILLSDSRGDDGRRQLLDQLNLADRVVCPWGSLVFRSCCPLSPEEYRRMHSVLLKDIGGTEFRIPLLDSSACQGEKGRYWMRPRLALPGFESLWFARHHGGP